MTEHRDANPVPALSLPFRVSGLSARKPTRFDLKPNGADRAALAQLLGITAVETLSFKGEILPIGRHDFALEAELVARVVQPCSITLQPVSTAISERIRRTYIEKFVLPDGDEIEMPEDDTAEPLPEVIDAGAVAIEALALALPLYPRAPGAVLENAVFADAGIAPLHDGDLKPFAGLAALKAKLAVSDTDENGGGSGGPSQGS